MNGPLTSPATGATGNVGVRSWMLYAALYGVVFWSITLFGGNMQNPVVDLTASIVENGRLSIDPYHTNSPDVAFKDGHYYSGMAPGASILAIPCYGAAKLFWALAPRPLVQWLDSYKSRSLNSQYSLLNTPRAQEQVLTHALMTIAFGHVAGALSFYLLFTIALRVTGDPAAARTAAIAYCFATMMPYYHASYYTQSMACFFLLLAVYQCLCTQSTPWMRWVGGLAAGVAGSIDYPYFVYGGLVVCGAFIAMVCARRPKRELAMAALGFAIPLALVMLYHRACFGSPFAPAYSFRAEGTLHQQGLEGIGLPRPERLAALLWSHDEGVLWLAPVFVFAPFGLTRIGRRAQKVWLADPVPATTVTLALALIGTAGFYFISVPWKSNMASYGPRFFLAAVPWLALLATPSAASRRLRWPFIVLLTLGILINHLNLIGVNLPKAIADSIAGSPAALGPVHLFRQSNQFGVGAGLTLAAAWQAILIAVIFGWPAWRRARRIAQTG